MNTQLKATEQCFPVVLFVMLYKVVLTFESVDEILTCGILIKVTEQRLPVIPYLLHIFSNGFNRNLM